jgi:Flp pilus assembly protein protease CpaA
MDWPLNIVVSLFVVLLLLAAWTDFATRLIPNCLPIAVALLGAATRLMTGMEALANSFGLALGIFCYFCYCTRVAHWAEATLSWPLLFASAFHPWPLGDSSS